MSPKGKKDFDKELMYSKIMPSYAKASAGGEARRAERNDSFGDAPRLHNYMEDIVSERMGDTMVRLSVCGCSRCREDVLALALNELPTVYAVADEAERERYIAKCKGHEVKISAAIIRAAQLVKDSPRH